MAKRRKTGFEKGFSLEKMLGAPFRWIAGLVQKDRGGGFEQNQSGQLSLGKTIGLVLTSPFWILYFCGVFAISKWATSRNAYGFVFGIPAFATIGIFVAMQIWLQGVGAEPRLKGYVKQRRKAETVEKWDRAISLANRCINDSSDSSHLFNLYRVLQKRIETVDYDQAGIPNVPGYDSLRNNTKAQDIELSNLIIEKLAPTTKAVYWDAHRERIRTILEQQTLIEDQESPEYQLLSAEVKKHAHFVLDLLPTQADGVIARENVDQVRAMMFGILMNIYEKQSNLPEASRFAAGLVSIQPEYAADLVRIEIKRGNEDQAEIAYRNGMRQIFDRLDSDANFRYYQAVLRLFASRKKFEESETFLINRLSVASERRKRSALKRMLSNVYRQWYTEIEDRSTQNSFSLRFSKMISAIHHQPYFRSMHQTVWNDEWMDYPEYSDEQKWLNRLAVLGNHTYVTDCLLGIKFFLLDDQERARKKWRIALQQGGRNAESVVSFAVHVLASLQPDKLEKCLEIFDVLEEIVPNNQPVEIWRALTYYNAERFEDAIPLIEHNLEVASHETLLMIALAVCYMETEDINRFEYIKNIINQRREKTSAAPLDFETELERLKSLYK